MIYRYIDIRKSIKIELNINTFIIRIICIFIAAISTMVTNKNIYIGIVVLLISIFAGDEIKSVISKIRKSKCLNNN